MHESLSLQVAVDATSRHRNALLDRLLDAAQPTGPGGPSLGSLMSSGGLLRFFGALAALSVAVVLTLTLVVALWAPKAAGGGVALVMAFLNGARGHEVCLLHFSGASECATQPWASSHSCSFMRCCIPLPLPQATPSKGC